MSSHIQRITLGKFNLAYVCVMVMELVWFSIWLSRISRTTKFHIRTNTYIIWLISLSITYNKTHNDNTNIYCTLLYFLSFQVRWYFVEHHGMQISTNYEVLTLANSGSVPKYTIIHTSKKMYLVVYFRTKQS